MSYLPRERGKIVLCVSHDRATTIYACPGGAGSTVWVSAREGAPPPTPTAGVRFGINSPGPNHWLLQLTGGITIMRLDPPAKGRSPTLLVWSYLSYSIVPPELRWSL